MPSEVRGGIWGIKQMPQEKIESAEFNIFYPRIHIYKGLLPQATDLVNILKKSSEDRSASYYFNAWSEWYKFGETIGWPSYNPIYPDLVNDEIKKKEESILQELEDAFAIATQHYLNFYKTKIGNNWTTMGPSICRYVAEKEHANAGILTMNYHTDYDYIRGDEPGDKMALTCTMYLNDDYEGGELWFDLDESAANMHFDLKPVIEPLKYKPSAGDIIVFPSGHPEVLSDKKTYFHAVSRTGKSKNKNSDKFFIRSHYLIPFEGTKEWHENKEKYGAEVWEKMETERIKARVKTHKELQMLKTSSRNSGEECGLA